MRLPNPAASAGKRQPVAAADQHGGAIEHILRAVQPAEADDADQVVAGALLTKLARSAGADFVRRPRPKAMFVFRDGDARRGAGKDAHPGRKHRLDDAIGTEAEERIDRPRAALES